MRKGERDRIMMHINQEQRAEFRRIIGEIRAARKATSGHRPAIRELVASGTIEVPPSLRGVVEALIERMVFVAGREYNVIRPSHGRSDDEQQDSDEDKQQSVHEHFFHGSLAVAMGPIPPTCQSRKYWLQIS
jgi:hypothetical protein